MDSIELCRLSIVPPATNLKKISIVTDFGTKLRNYPSPPGLKIQLFYGREASKDVKLIAKGGNGIIYLFYWEYQRIILKFPFKEPYFEPERVENTLKGYQHDIIPYRIIYDQWKNPFMIMQQASGSIYELIGKKVTAIFRYKMIRHYSKAIYDFWRKGLVFTDMKPENLLYQCYRPGVISKSGIHMYFGDIGAFSIKGETTYDYEVEPPENVGIVDKNFCLFSIGLMVIGIFDFSYSRPEKDKPKSYQKKFYEPLSSQIDKFVGNKKIASLTKKLLMEDSFYREKLGVKEVVDMINEKSKEK
jgi:serine/threonine protein kinase